MTCFRMNFTFLPGSKERENEETWKIPLRLCMSGRDPQRTFLEKVPSITTATGHFQGSSWSTVIWSKPILCRLRAKRLSVQSTYFSSVFILMSHNSAVQNRFAFFTTFGFSETVFIDTDIKGALWRRYQKSSYIVKGAVVLYDFKVCSPLADCKWHRF
jgi:hypothetical protein